ncbi:MULTISPECIES: hypothetical protein [unclassified Methylobacterium]|jgi:hypothetical protein|uniref:DUF6894 family protein n=1 Tax=unclassified Methylobacterium TaxID=2615210 RepID=UPI0005BCF40A|nr:MULTISPECIES: hypothetical protein [unclassified Methylobacterium]SFV13063.1 hypothetical protein SAMN02799643_05822 [Methylobacterium sp. UNCCL125]
MPRYFFDITAGAATVDNEGTEFPNAHAARDAAIKTLPEIACDEIQARRSRMVSVLMRDEAGRHLFAASLNLSAQWLVETA